MYDILPNYNVCSSIMCKAILLQRLTVIVKEGKKRMPCFKIITKKAYFNEKMPIILFSEMGFRCT